MKKYFWEEYEQKTIDYFNKWVLNNKDTFGLNNLYGIYYNKYIQKLNEVTIEEYTKLENREKFLIYLSTLLRAGELKMKTFELFEKYDPDGFEGKVFSFHNGREWKQEEIEEGIKFVREKWNSIDREREEYLKTGE